MGYGKKYVSIIEIYRGGIHASRAVCDDRKVHGRDEFLPYVLPNHIVSIPQIPTFEKPRI